MTRGKWVAALAALMLVVVALPAHAVTRTDGQTANPGDLRCDNPVYDSATGKWFCPEGTTVGTSVIEAYPARDHILQGILTIISGSFATGAADSLESPLDVHDYPNLSLLLERTGSGEARVAIQVRYHIAGFTDTSSTFPWMPVTTGGLTAWGDSAFSCVATPTASAPGGDEGLFKMTRQAAIAPGMTGRRLIPIAGPSGPQHFDYITVRLRVLGQYSTSTYRVSLVGTAVR